MAKDELPDMKEYLDALARRDDDIQCSPNHSEDCSFESFKIAADCLVGALASRKNV